MCITPWSRGIIPPYLLGMYSNDLRMSAVFTYNPFIVEVNF